MDSRSHKQTSNGLDSHCKHTYCFLGEFLWELVKMPSNRIEMSFTQNYEGTTLNTEMFKGELYVVDPFQK